jgi:Protein of unknown function (DUF3253)
VDDESRWITIDGRRWRATDPHIPETFRHELVDELMSARREVGRARRAGHDARERDARARVQHAKVALGERGQPWWERPSREGREARVRATTLALAEHRSPERTICPSDVARAVGGDGWRTLMEPVRSVVKDLARRGEVEILQRGEVVDPDHGWRGPIRIRRRPRTPPKTGASDPPRQPA